MKNIGSFQRFWSNSWWNISSSLSIFWWQLQTAISVFENFAAEENNSLSNSTLRRKLFNAENEMLSDCSSSEEDTGHFFPYPKVTRCLCVCFFVPFFPEKVWTNQAIIVIDFQRKFFLTGKNPGLSLHGVQLEIYGSILLVDDIWWYYYKTNRIFDYQHINLFKTIYGLWFELKR